MKHLKLFFALFAMLALGVTNAWAETVFSETFGAGTTSNTAYSSFTKYSATTEMFTDGKDVKTHYSGDGKVGKNNLSEANLSSGYDGASGGSGCYHSGVKNTQKTIISISCINIQNYSDLTLSFGALGGSTTHKIDVTYSIDGSTETSLISSGSITNKNWSLLSAQIQGKGNSLTLYFKHTPGNTWTVRLDDIKITGTLSSETPDDPTCTAITPTLTYSETSLVQGGTAAATLEGNTGNGEVTYTTSDDKIATVAADGTITAVGAGTATITANIAAAGEYCDGKATTTITVIPLVSCSEVYGLADDATFVLKDFTVTYVNGKYTYIKDNTGYGLIFNNAGEYGLKAGDQVASTKLEGKKDTYNGLVEIIPTTTFANLEFTSGTAPAPEAMNVLPANADVNKYVKFEDVTFASTGFSSKKVTGKINAGDITFYDQFATNATFNTSKKYDVIGAVSIYNSTIQVNFISAEEVAGPTLNVKITDADFGKVAINGSHERTLTLNGSLLTKPVELTIEGDYFTLASNSITPTDGSIEEAKIKITYKPTVEGTHTATLKITSDELAEQTITLQGQAVQQHTVYFFVNGEEQTGLAKKVLSGDKLTEIPTATSCDPLEYPTFIGWSASEITGTTDVEPTNLLDLNTPITSDCNYYAVFAKSTTTGSAEDAETITIANFKDGVDADGTQALYESTSATWEWLKNSSSSKINTTYEQIRLYASHTLTISPKGGYTITKIVAAISENKYVTPFAAGGLTGATSSADGLNVTLTPTGGDIVITQAAQSRATSFTVTYAAASTENTYLTTCESVTPTYTVTYNLDGGSSTCETSVVVEQNGELTLCDAPTKTGHTFLKWKDQSDNEYEAGATITVSSNLTLTAQWQKDSYKVTWMSLGNEVSSANVEYNEQPTKPADPTYTCGIGTKYFAGWTTEEIDGIGIPTNLYVDNLPAVTEAITYYAVFASKSAEAITTTSTLINTENLGQYKAGTAIDDQGETWNYYAGGGTDENINLRNNPGESSYIESPKFTGIVQSISAYVKNGSTSARKVYLRSTATASPTEGDLGETTIAGSNNSNVTFTIANGKSFNQFYIQVSGGLQFNNIVVTSVIAEGAFVDYITSCEALEVSIDVNEKVEFEPTKVEKTNTKNLAITTSNFDGTLEFEISGKDAAFFTYGIYVEGELPLTYQPAEGGNHEATLTITAGQVQATVQLIGTGVEYTVGIWELVTDESTLSVDDQIVIVAKDENYALSTTQNSNNRGQAEVEKNTSNNTIAFGDDVQVLTLHAGKDEGTFALYAANYLSDGVKKNGYLYAASTTANHLKTKNSLEDNDNNYWTISVTKGVATIKAQSTSRNWLRHNGNSDIFSCYDSGQSDVQIYRKKTYTRTVTPGNYGTICLKEGAKEYSGATFYEVAGKEGHKIILDEVTELEAGMPYIFCAEAAVLKITLGYETASEAGKHNSLQGTFTKIEDGEAGAAGNTLEGNYIIYNNYIKKCGAKCGLYENRAYFIASEMESLGLPPTKMPGRRRVAMGYESENQATGVDNITENGVVAPAMQGIYDIMGRQLSEPTATGFYIVNGKKVLVVK